MNRALKAIGAQLSELLSAIKRQKAAWSRRRKFFSDAQVRATKKQANRRFKL